MMKPQYIEDLSDLAAELDEMDLSTPVREPSPSELARRRAAVIEASGFWDDQPTVVVGKTYERVVARCRVKTLW